ncbi:zinc finger and SCAN domain containing 5B [Phyllostomus discolor]|uniref:Zinc finger and SCAN domain containing 5B n=1 Tax=Phyllostomus discolor TaxID=89673 RepID=A0A833YW58_9CHIR|nr:zinc finger and SCAN domain containing 5B [Phyllostomus discolor]
MAAHQTFQCGPGNPQEGRGPQLLPSALPQGSLPGRQGREAEMWHVAFRAFTSSEDSDPVQDLQKLSELCRLWLRPDLHTPEQILDKLVLEQFMISMPLELQVLVKDYNVQSCKDLEDILRRQEKPKTWTIVTIEGQKFLVPNSDVQMAGVEVGDEDPVMGLSMKSRSFMCEAEVHGKNSQEVSQEPENQPEIKDVSREQGQTALSPETIPEEGNLVRVRPTQILEEDLMEDQEEMTVLAPPETQRLGCPEVSLWTERKDNLPEGADTENANSTHHLETDILPQCRKRKHSQAARGPLRRECFNPSMPQDVSEEGAVCLDEGALSRQLRSHSGQAQSPVGTTVRKGARWRTLSECADCKKTFIYESQLTIHQRSHTGERPFQCQLCPKKFTQPSDLRVHQRVHTGEKPYSCQICGKSFAHESTLRGHQKVHTGEKPYSCKICQKRFGHKGNFNVHLRTHTGLRPHRCPECGQDFRQVGALKRHKQTHLNVTP